MNTCAICGIDFRHEDRTQVDLHLCPTCAPCRGDEWVMSRRIQSAKDAVVKAAKEVNSWTPPDEFDHRGLAIDMRRLRIAFLALAEAEG